MKSMLATEVHPRTGKGKVEQYGWVLKDKPGDLVWLKKSELIIDHSYQRNANSSRVLLIAREWSWLACGVIIVARRVGSGFLYVVEGQHRVLAALKRSDIDCLPCIVFETESAKEEAAGFYAANTGRRMPTTLEKWKAQLMIGDPDTLFADSLIKKAGRMPGNNGGANEVRCLSSLLGVVKKNRPAIISVWPLIAEVCYGSQLHENILEGLFYIESNLPEGQSLSDKRWCERVIRVGYSRLLDGAQRAASLYRRGGAKVWATGMLEEINKVCRIRITLRGDE
jgi:hypothetical protein